MNSYKIISYCKLCNKRLVTLKGEQKQFYCEDCRKKMERYKQSEEDK